MHLLGSPAPKRDGQQGRGRGFRTWQELRLRLDLLFAKRLVVAPPQEIYSPFFSTPFCARSHGGRGQARPCRACHKHNQTARGGAHAAARRIGALVPFFVVRIERSHFCARIVGGRLRVHRRADNKARDHLALCRRGRRWSREA